jgi:hypothetical protein
VDVRRRTDVRSASATLPSPNALSAQPIRVQPRAEPEHAWVTTVAMVIGLGSGVSARFIGDVFIGELAVLVLLPFAILQARGEPLSRPFKVLLLTGLLWFVSLVLTDAVRGSAPVDYLRGWANVAVFFADLFVIYRLVGRHPMRHVLLIASFALGQLIGLLVEPTPFMRLDLWKFGLATPLTFLVLCVPLWFGVRSAQPARITIPVGMLAILAAANLLRDNRAEGAICGVAITIVLLSRVFQPRYGRVRSFARAGAARSAVTLLGISAAGLLAIAGYSAAAQDGVLGADAQAKFYSEYQPGLAIVIGGRGEILVSSQAIADSPILGHGSWAQDAKYLAIAEVVRSQGYNVVQLAPDSPDSQLIPSHSHLFGAWVEAGLLGAVCWLCVLILLLRSFSRMTASVSPFLPLCAYFGVHLTWDVLFSPFSGSVRLFDALMLATILTIMLPVSVFKAGVVSASVGEDSTHDTTRTLEVPKYGYRR